MKKELLQSVQEAVDIERGKAKPSRVFKVETPDDVSAIRRKLKLSRSFTAGLFYNVLAPPDRPLRASKSLLIVIVILILIFPNLPRLRGG